MDLINTLDEEFNENVDEIIKTAVVYPEDFNPDRMPAGIVSRPCSRNIEFLRL